ncbi:MAG: sulfotransferase [Candidatus Promineifilaceae bacterium]|nr:sulfotransferase [Candidatus Promineifilaceae bacterium]
MKGLFNKIFKSEQEKPIIVVSGLPRSGTSMLMKMLEAGGIPPLTDSIRTADDDNPKGYYEFERVKAMDKGDVSWLPDAHGKAVKVISALLKYLPADYEYKIIYIRRNMAEILASQRKMLVRRGEDPDKIDDAQMAALFAKHVAQVEEWLKEQSNMSVLYVHYSDILSNPQAQANRINDFLDRQLDGHAMAAVVDPSLYRNKQEQQNRV